MGLVKVECKKYDLLAVAAQLEAMDRADLVPVAGFLRRPVGFEGDAVLIPCHTQKHLSTLKLSNGLVVEQIDFFIGGNKERSFRSVSIEGKIPSGIIVVIILSLHF